MDLIKDLISIVSSYPVKEVLVGIFQTLVWSKNCGLSSTLKQERCPHVGVRESGSLINKNVKELSQYLLSDNLLEASIGMAAINSALHIEREKLETLNAKDLILEKGTGKIVGVVGYFPFLGKIKHKFNELYIFEKFPGEGDLKEEEIQEFLPRADVVAITGTSISNHTFENILKYTKRESYIIVLGPSTPVSPLLFEYGVDAISGILVQDIPFIISQVKEPTPFRYLKGVDYVTLVREDYFA